MHMKNSYALSFFTDVTCMCIRTFRRCESYVPHALLHRCESYVHLWQCLSDMLKKFQNFCGISLYNGANLGLDP
jgi:hypothetical protein